jgi:hypothetical protein
MSEPMSYELEPQVIPSELAIVAMRDSGYKNTAYAIAELIDNSQQAGASEIEVICLETEKFIEERRRSRIDRLAVIDDGQGMDAGTLRMALQFGNGTRLNDRSGIGRFGMGLPNASISQAGRVDVWSWQNGPDNALHSYIDVDEIRGGHQRYIPEPQHNPVPDEWRGKSEIIGKTGTLVVWTKLDPTRLTWKTSKATLHNTEELVGRVYRNFIDSGELNLRLYAENGSGKGVLNHVAKLVDPLYLKPSPLVPQPFENVAMFDFVDEEVTEIEYNGSLHKVTTRYSVAKSTTIQSAGSQDRGKTPYGKHASHNVGVSVLRAGRELMLDQGWCIGYDPRERWWGAEVEFPPSLDEVFGVTNNKQAATHFSELASLQWEQLAEEDETERDVAERLKAEGDPRGWLLDLSNSIKRNLDRLRKIIKSQGAGKRQTVRRHDEVDDATKSVNEGWKSRSEQRPIEGEDEKLDDFAYESMKEDLTGNKQYSVQDAEMIIDLVKEKDLRAIFLEADFPGPNDLFGVERKGSITEIIFNRNHPAFDYIFGTVKTTDEDISDLSKQEILDRLVRSINASKVIFAAWARYEREASVDRAKALAKVRAEWGQIAANFLDGDQDDLL